MVDLFQREDEVQGSSRPQWLLVVVGGNMMEVGQVGEPWLDNDNFKNKNTPHSHCFIFKLSMLARGLGGFLSTNESIRALLTLYVLPSALNF